MDAFDSMSDREVLTFAKQNLMKTRGHGSTLMQLGYKGRADQERADKAEEEKLEKMTPQELRKHLRDLKIKPPEGESNPQVYDDKQRDARNILDASGKNVNTGGKSQEEHEKALDEESKQNPFVLSSRQQKATTSKDKQDTMPSIRGDIANCVNEAHPWLQVARGMAMPIRAGISGTTDRFVNTAGMLGVSPLSHIRMAMLGYLIPQNAHSFHEIMSAAARGGLDYKAGDYTYIPPIDSGVLKSMGADEVSQNPADKTGAAVAK
jgi:hypothetical protein